MADKIVQRIRVLEYIGPESWVDGCKRRSFVQLFSALGKGKAICSSWSDPGELTEDEAETMLSMLPLKDPDYEDVTDMDQALWRIERLESEGRAYRAQIQKLTEIIREKEIEHVASTV